MQNLVLNLRSINQSIFFHLLNPNNQKFHLINQFLYIDAIEKKTNGQIFTFPFNLRRYKMFVQYHQENALQSNIDHVQFQRHVSYTNDRLRIYYSMNVVRITFFEINLFYLLEYRIDVLMMIRLLMVMMMIKIH